jgi:hypothetical protein
MEVNPVFSVETTDTFSYFSLGGGLFSVKSRDDGTDVGLLYFFDL